MYHGDEEGLLNQKFRPPEETITDDIIEDIETTRNYEQPSDELLIEPNLVASQQLAVPLSLGLLR